MGGEHHMHSTSINVYNNHELCKANVGMVDAQCMFQCCCYNLYTCVVSNEHVFCALSLLSHAKSIVVSQSIIPKIACGLRQINGNDIHRILIKNTPPTSSISGSAFFLFFSFEVTFWKAAKF